MSRPPVFELDAVVDPVFAKDVVKAILAAIFFHRLFPSVRPRTRDLLDLTLPSVDDPDLDALIESRTSTLLRSLSPQPSQIAVQFFEKRTKRPKTWFSSRDEEVCWEEWVINITLLSPRTEAERTKARKTMERVLGEAVMKIIEVANGSGEDGFGDHIPPITTSDYNPFPYKIFVPEKGSYAGRGGTGNAYAGGYGGSGEVKQEQAWGGKFFG